MPHFCEIGCKVVGQLVTVVSVIHGSRLIKCTSLCRVIKVPFSDASNENSAQTPTDKYVTADKSNLHPSVTDPLKALPPLFFKPKKFCMPPHI